RAIEALAPSLGVQLTRAAVREAAEVGRAIDEFARESNGGLMVLPSPIAFLHRELIIALAVQYRLPALYPFRSFSVTCGLMSYGINPPHHFRQAPGYVYPIFKAERSAQFPC